MRDGPRDGLRDSPIAPCAIRTVKLGACVHTSRDACMMETAPPHPPRAIEW